MSFTLRFAQFVIIAACLSAAVSQAFAQAAAPPRATGGLFGATRSDVGKRDKLNFMFQLSEGLDSALPPEVNSRVSRGLDSGGLSTVFQATSDYQHRSRTLQLKGGASTAFRHYQDADRLNALSHNATLGAGIKVPGGNLRLEQSAAYSPSYLYGLIPTATPLELGEIIPTSPQYQIEQTNSYRYTTEAALALGSPRATQATVTGDFDRTDFVEQTSARLDLKTHGAGAEVSRRLSPRGRVNIGYKFHTGEFGYGGRTTEQRADLGAEYSPALSKTRRATFRLTVSPSRIDLPETALQVTALEHATAGATASRLYRFSGEAGIELPFSRNWRTAATYRRSIEYLSILNQPVLADGGGVELQGLITRRMDLTVSGGYVTAASAFAPNTQPLETYTGQVGLRVALKRWLALRSEYSYYFYNLGEQADVSRGLPTAFVQHGVRIGFVVFLEPLRP